MLHVFHVNVAKAELGCCNVAIAMQVCCKRVFQMLQVFFNLNIASVFHI
jgi:hypothetical protein